MRERGAFNTEINWDVTVMIQIKITESGNCGNTKARVILEISGKGIISRLSEEEGESGLNWNLQVWFMCLFGGN